jgi:hypothetical protein
MLSSVLHSGATGVGGADATVTDTDRLINEVNLGARSLVVRVNHAHWAANASEVAAAVDADVSIFADLYAESKAASGSVAVDVAFENATSRLGYRLVQTADADFSSADDDGDWEPIPKDQNATVGWFTANLDLQNTSDSPITVNASNGSRYIETEISKDQGNLSVKSTPSWAAPQADETCEATGERVLLDLYDGTAFNSDCPFNGIALLDDPISIEFEDSSRIEGRYTIVANNRSTDQLDDEVYHSCTDGSATVTDPCLHPIIWSANLSTTVQSERLGYRNRYNLSIYPGAA